MYMYMIRGHVKLKLYVSMYFMKQCTYKLKNCLEFFLVSREISQTWTNWILFQRELKVVLLAVALLLVLDIYRFEKQSLAHDIADRKSVNKCLTATILQQGWLTLNIKLILVNLNIPVNKKWKLHVFTILKEFKAIFLTKVVRDIYLEHN